VPLADVRLFSARYTVRRFVSHCIPVSSANTRRDPRSKSKSKGSPYPITERRVSELIPVLGSQPASVASHTPGSRLPLLSARPAVTPPPNRKKAATNFAAW